MSGSGEQSLPQLQRRAQELERQLDSLQTSSQGYEATVRDAIQALEACRSAVDRLALFSPNETLEDVSTASLQYLTLASRLADVRQKEHAQDHRVAALHASQSSYASFLSTAEQYGLLSATDRKLYSRFLEDRLNFSVVPAGTDPAARRNTKISRLHDEKVLKAKLEELQKRSKAGANGGSRSGGRGSLRATSDTTNNASQNIHTGNNEDNDEYDNDNDGDDDDEVTRSLRLAEIQMRIHAAFEALDMIGQELRILASAPSSTPGPDPRQLVNDHRDRTRGSPNNDGASSSPFSSYSERLDPSTRTLLANGRAGPILDARGKPLQPFVLLDRRSDIRAGVFRSGHRLPTMSIDEYLEEERRRGGIIEGGGDRPPVEPNEDDVEAADAETLKQREWDEFKEENPRGSGNTINRG